MVKVTENRRITGHNIPRQADFFFAHSAQVEMATASKFVDMVE